MTTYSWLQGWLLCSNLNITVFAASRALRMLVCIDALSEDADDHVLYTTAACYRELLPYHTTAAVCTDYADDSTVVAVFFAL